MSIEKKEILSYAGDIWSTADILRGVSIKDSHWPEYMMPLFALLMIESRIVRKIKEYEKKFGSRDEAIQEYTYDVDDKIKSNQNIYGMNKLLIENGITLAKVCENDTGFDKALQEYLNAYDPETKDLLGITPRDGDNKLDINKYIKILDDKNAKFQYLKAWSKIDLTDFNNSEITTLEEHIKRKWADISAETAGQQYTPDDIIALISEISVRYYEDHSESTKNINIYDMTCGGGNMLFGIEDNINNMLIYKNVPEGDMPCMMTHGQEYESSLYALAKIEGRFRDDSKIEYGNTLINDQFPNTKMNIIAANPPYGVDWKHEEGAIRNDKTGRFHYFPTVSDGQMLFLQHAIAKLTDVPNQLSLGCIVLNGSPLFSGDAGSGESEIRKWILDNDYLEALIQLPTNEFFNTGITTYIWVLNKNKKPENKNKIKLIDSSEMFTKLKKSKGKKSKELNESARKQIVEWLISNVQNEKVKVFDRSYFYYNKQKITLNNVDIKGKSFIPVKNNKVVKSVKIEDVDKFILNDDKANSFVSVGEIDDFKSLAKSANNYFKTLVEGSFSFIKDRFEYGYDTEKESLFEKDLGSKHVEYLGCGEIKIKASYKAPTKTRKETYSVFAELSPKKETDYEIVPFSFNEEENKKNIQDFMDKWVEKEYTLGDRTVGAEVNFNKIFYKPEELRPLEEIKNDLLASHDKLSQLMSEVFDD